MDHMKPFVVLVGHNGSGKSTVLDVFAFLSECFTIGLRKAWEKRNRFRELRSRGCTGPIVVEIKYREARGKPLTTYHLSINEGPKGPVVEKEFIQWKRGRRGRPFKFLDYQMGDGVVFGGKDPDATTKRESVPLDSPETLAVSTLGQLSKNPRVMALRRFITSWQLSSLTADATRGNPAAGGQEHLSSTGDNLPNVVQYLGEQHPDILAKIMKGLTQRVPRLESVGAKPLDDGRLLLVFKDAPFQQPILSKYASDGTLKMLSYMVLLHDPEPPQLIGIEEPENYLHPTILPGLADEFRMAAQGTQIVLTTHSPYFVNSLNADETYVLFRDQDGFTQVKRASEMQEIPVFMEEGAKLGQLWMEGYFETGYPGISDPQVRAIQNEG